MSLSFLRAAATRIIDALSTIEIPAIDLTSFADDSDPAARVLAAASLDAAAEHIGFFYMSLPGLAEAAERLLLRCVDFHSQPMHAKQAVASELSPLRRGYNVTWQTGGGSCAAKAGVDPPDPKEVFMLGSEGDASPMHGSNQWPDTGSLPGWRAAVQADWDTMLWGARCLASALAAALGEPAGTFDQAMATPATVLIMLRYDVRRSCCPCACACAVPSSTHAPAAPTTSLHPHMFPSPTASPPALPS